MRFGRVFVLLSLIGAIGFLAYRVELAFPKAAPALSQTLTPNTQLVSADLGSYDVLGHVISQTDAETLLQSPEGQQQLSPENGAIAVTQELVDLGRDAFYTETFGNEVFFTDVAGAIAGPINLKNLARSILALGGKPTTNLQVTLDQTVTIGGKTFEKGTVLNTGLDVPKGSLLPLA